jgi:hypothetical protein
MTIIQIIIIVITFGIIATIVMSNSTHNNLFTKWLSILISSNMMVLILPLKFNLKELLLVIHYILSFTLIFSIYRESRKPAWIPFLLVLGIGFQFFNNLTNIFYLKYFNGFGIYYLISQILLFYGCLFLIKLDYKKFIILLLYVTLGFIDIFKLCYP